MKPGVGLFFMTQRGQFRATFDTWASPRRPVTIATISLRVGFNYRFGPRGGPGLLESTLPARDTLAFNSDFLPCSS
jgi:hypothetical protein